MYGDINNYVHLAYQPMETAISNHDELSKLLAVLGAPVDVGLVQSLSKYPDLRSRRTVREWIDYAIDNLTVEIDKLKKEQADADAEDVSMKDEPKEEVGWMGFYRKYQASLMVPDFKKDQKERDAERRKDSLDRMNDIKDFFVELRNLIKTENPKTWKDVYPSLETQAHLNSTPLPNRGLRAAARRQATMNNKQERDYSYALLATSGHNLQNVPEHTVAVYNELYEACFVGDNDKIQRLCLPIEGQGTSATSGAPGPLNISVKMITKATGRYDQTGKLSIFDFLSSDNVNIMCCVNNRLYPALCSNCRTAMVDS